MRKEEDEDLRVKKLIGEITKLLPERSKIKTDLLYFKYAPILVMLFRWYGISQFYDNKMEITLWYEENEEPVWYFYFITYILYPISLWKGQPPDADEICHALSDIGCNGNPLSEAYEHLTKESVDRGLTYSNLSERRSVLAIGKCESDGSIINTIGHELLHVVAHICEQDGIDMLSEEPCYMMGSLCEKFFDVSSVNNVN